ncbi:MAG: hypothetical protein JAY66_11085 [Candidatus Thiodiazotropha taylori]|nr:hypothetical protein [Candidatus Thiodiazotropha taylori]
MKCLPEDGDNKVLDLVETGRSQTRNSLDEKLTSDDFDPERSNLSVVNFNDLVPKSPIISASENVARQETFTLSMPPFMGKFTEGQSSKKVKLSERSKSFISNSHQLKTKESSTDQVNKGSRTLTVSLQKTKSIAQCLRDTYVSEIPFKPGSTLRRTSVATETAIETKLVDHNEAKGEIENPFKPKPTLKRTPEASGGIEEKSKEEKGEDKNQSQTKAKFKLHTASKAVIATSLQTSEDETVVAYPDHVENLFKPTQNLLGSPSPADELYSKPFLAKMGNNVDLKGIESEPLLVSRFADKKTTYIGTDMDITAPLSVSDKRSHFVNSMEQTEFQDKDTRESKTDKTNAKVKEHEFEARKDERTKCKKICRNSNTVDYKNLKHHENMEQRESFGIEKETQKALDEIWIGNSGEFSFTASRKEADGSRKPVLETILSSARSKTKRLTPEKDIDPNIVQDKDIYNFGSRTPIILLDKTLEKKESSLYDLSIKESVIFRTASPNEVQSDLQESVETRKNVLDGTSTKDQLDCSIYHCPLKGSLGGKPKQTRGRPKSRTRSKSRTRILNDSDDGDCVPCWSRSNSRSRKNSGTNCDGFYSPRSKSRSRGRSRTRKCVDLSDKPGSRSIRSKSQTRQPSESESKRTVARNHSSRARSKIRIKSSRGSASENVQSKSENEDPENKSKDNAKDKVNIAILNERDSDSGFQNKVWQRRKRRRQTKVNKETDGGIDSDTVDYYELKSKTTEAAFSPVKDISNKIHYMDRLSDDASYSSLLCSDISSNVANKCGRSLESGLKGKITKDQLNQNENEGSYIGTEVEHVSVENNRKTGYSGTLISNFHPAKLKKMQTDEDVVNYRSANSKKEHKIVTTEDQLNFKSPGVQNIKADESSESVKTRSKQVEINKITKSVKNQSMSELEALETPDKEVAVEEENVCGDKMVSKLSSLNVGFLLLQYFCCCILLSPLPCFISVAF